MVKNSMKQSLSSIPVSQVPDPSSENYSVSCIFFRDILCGYKHMSQRTSSLLWHKCWHAEKKVLRLAFFHLPIYLETVPHQYMGIYRALFSTVKFFVIDGASLVRQIISRLLYKTQFLVGMSSSEQVWAFDVPYELLLEMYGFVLWSFTLIQGRCYNINGYIPGPCAFMLQFRLVVIQPSCTTISLELVLETPIFWISYFWFLQ